MQSNSAGVMGGQHVIVLGIVFMFLQILLYVWYQMISIFGGAGFESDNLW